MHPFEHSLRNTQGNIPSLVPRTALTYNKHAGLILEKFFQPVGWSLRCFDQLAGDETSHQPMPLPIWCVVINQKIVGVSSRLRQALHGLLIRLWNRAERHGLPTATHPNEYSSDVQS